MKKIVYLLNIFILFLLVSCKTVKSSEQVDNIIYQTEKSIKNPNASSFNNHFLYSCERIYCYSYSFGDSYKSQVLNYINNLNYKVERRVPGILFNEYSGKAIYVKTNLDHYRIFYNEIENNVIVVDYTNNGYNYAITNDIDTFNELWKPYDLHPHEYKYKLNNVEGMMIINPFYECSSKN